MDTRQNFEMTVKHDYGVFGGNEQYPKILRVVSWRRQEPKFDIRMWRKTEDGETALKGLSISRPEAEKLYCLLSEALRTEPEAGQAAPDSQQTE